MQLYHHKITESSFVTASVIGTFIPTDGIEEQLLLAKGSMIELYKVQGQVKRNVQLVHKQNVFGQIKAMKKLTSTSESCDSVIITTESGAVTILQFDEESQSFKTALQEYYTNTPNKRNTPGVYLSVDRFSRAMLIGAISNSVVGYVVTEDENGELTISQPMQMETPNTIIYDMVALQTSEDSEPMFASIEVNHEASDLEPDQDGYEVAEKQLVFYTLNPANLELTRTVVCSVDMSAHHLIPSNVNLDEVHVLVCWDNHLGVFTQEGEIYSTVIPRSVSQDVERSSMIVTNCEFTNIKEKMILLQNDLGDLFMIHVDMSKAEMDVQIKYYETTPIARGIAILRCGCLFVATETGNHILYNILKFETIDFKGTIDIDNETYPTFKRETNASDPILKVGDEIPSMGPIIQMKCANLGNEQTDQYYCLSGSGDQSYLRVLRNGLPMQTSKELNQFPKITDVFSLPDKQGGTTKYVLISSERSTTVLEAKERDFSLMENGIFDKDTATINCGLLGTNTYVQVYSTGIKYIKGDTMKNWSSNAAITCCSMNERQIIVGCVGGIIEYFELDNEDNFHHVGSENFSEDIMCLGIGQTLEGQDHASYFGVGLRNNETVMLLSLNASDRWLELDKLILTSQPTSMAISLLEHQGVQAPHFVVGTKAGVVYRTEIEGRQLSKDVLSRRISDESVKLISTMLNQKPAVVCASRISWVFYTYERNLKLIPLSCSSKLKSIARLNEETFFSAEQHTTRLATISGFGKQFGERSVRLQFTPRAIAFHPVEDIIYVLESDHGVKPKKSDNAMVDDADDDNDRQLKYKPQSGRWCSSIRVLDGITLETKQVKSLPENMGAFSMGLVSTDDGPRLVVGGAPGVSFQPMRLPDGGRLIMFDLSVPTQLKRLGSIRVPEVPNAITPYVENLVLVGMGRHLCLYAAVHSRLSMKSIYSRMPSRVKSITFTKGRIFVADQTESVHFFRFDLNVNEFICEASNTLPRWMTAMCHLDANTVMGADKFGNVFVARVPPTQSQSNSEENLINDWMWQRGHRDEAPHKSEEMVSYHVGDIITSLQRIPPSSPAQQSTIVLYSTISGEIGLFVKLENISFFSLLEMHLRRELPPLSGNTHLGYRSKYYPCRSMIDGNLIEMFDTLPTNVKDAVADDLELNATKVNQRIVNVIASTGF